MPREHDYSMDLGEVKGGIKALRDSMERVLDWQEGFPQRMEEDRRRIYERMEKRDADNNKILHEIQESVEQVKGRVENLSDTMETHGAGLVDHESRLADLEIKEKIRRSRSRWLVRLVARVAAVLAALFGGDQIAGGKLLKALGMWFRAKPPGS